MAVAAGLSCAWTITKFNANDSSERCQCACCDRMGLVTMLAKHSDHHRLLPSSALPHASLAWNWYKASRVYRLIGGEAHRAVTWTLAHRSILPAAQPARHNKPVVVTAGMKQQQYRNEFEDYAAQGPTYWEQRLSKIGIEPLTHKQQGSRYAGSWLGPPLQLDPALRRTSSIMSQLKFSLGPQQLQLLLDGDINDPALRKAFTKFSWESLPHYHDHRIEPIVATWETCWITFPRQLQDYSLDHIIPSSLAGEHHPRSYFLMPREVNNYFGNSWTAEKVAYIGAAAALAAGRHRDLISKQHSRAS